MMYLAGISIFLRKSLTAGTGQPSGNSKLQFWVQIWHIAYLYPSDVGSGHWVIFKMSGTCFSSSGILEQGTQALLRKMRPSSSCLPSLEECSVCSWWRNPAPDWKGYCSSRLHFLDIYKEVEYVGTDNS